MSDESMCWLCNNQAAVRVHGTAMCSACAVASTGEVAVRPARRPRWRRAPRVLVVGGIMAAVAALGAAATAMTLTETPTPAVSTAPHLEEPPGDETAVPPSGQHEALPETHDDSPANEVPPSGDDLVAIAEAASVRANEFAAAMQAWAGCISRTASSHDGGTFDRAESCGPQPSPTDHGLTPHAATAPGDDDTTPPGHTKNDDTDTTPPRHTKNDDTDTTPPGHTKNEKKDE